MTVAWAGRFLDVVVADGWEYARRVRDIDAAVILALTDAREVVLVEQNRVPLGRRSIELPAGLVGDDIAGEEAAASAARELEEETGFRAAHWEEIGRFATSPGMSSETFRLYRATGLTRVGRGGGAGDEAITVHVVALDALPAWLAGKRAEGCAVDSRVMALLPLV